MQHYYSPEEVGAASFDLVSLLEPNTMRRLKQRRWVNDLMATMVDDVERRQLGIAEGKVASARPLYRRLDCDGRVLAYLKPRASIYAVRADIPPSWLKIEPCCLSVATTDRGLSASLLIEKPQDVDEFISFLIGVVAETRAALVRAMRPPNWDPWEAGRAVSFAARRAARDDGRAAPSVHIQPPEDTGS